MIVGLGNPGKKYAGSRHNVGFLTVDRFAALHGFPPPRERRRAAVFEHEVAGERVMLVKPLIFMNLSGGAVRDVLARTPLWERVVAVGEGEERAVPLRDCVLVIHDDMDLPLGKLRFRARGSSGGHRGVASVISSLRTDAFGRLKIGVGRPPGVTAADYVLETVRGKDSDRIREAVDRAARTLPVWIAEGVEFSANRFNSLEGEASAESSS